MALLPHGELKSAIAEHAMKDNHIIKWDNASILARDDNRNTRWIRESIWIRRKANNDNKNLMNGDEGAYHLSHLYYDLIQRASSSTSDDVTKTSRNTISSSGSIIIH